MGNRVGKRFQLSVRFFQFGGPCYNPLFKLLVQFTDFILGLFLLRDIAKSHDSTMLYGVGAFQGMATGFDPHALNHLRVPNKNLGSARFSSNGAC